MKGIPLVAFIAEGVCDLALGYHAYHIESFHRLLLDLDASSAKKVVSETEQYKVW